MRLNSEMALCQNETRCALLVTVTLMSSRLSIPRRVFLGFVLVLTVSGLVSVASIVQHQRTAATLSLLREGYLPLALLVSEGRATQSVLGNLLERMMSERSTRATRAWLNAGRRGRPRLLEQAMASVGRIEATAPPAPERKTLSRIRRDLKHVQRALRIDEPLYDRLYEHLDEGDRDGAQQVLTELRARERNVDARLRSAWNTILARIEATSAAAAEQQTQFVTILVVLGIVGFMIGVLVTVWSQRMLSPLPRLQQRVEAVARGDLVRRLEPTGDDEIGRLTQEFERMVAALAARDQRLREASENQRRLQQMQAQILADLSAAVLVVDADGVLLAQNPSAERLFGIEHSAAGLRLSNSELGIQLPSLLEAIDDVSGKGVSKTLLEETFHGDTERLLNLIVTPFGSETNDARRRQVLVVVEDVTEAVRTKARLIQTERLAAIGRMAAHVTHEVRNPLSSIGLNVELLEEELRDAGPSSRELVTAIQREIDRLRSLTEEYLRVARLPTPDLTVEPITDLVRAVTDFMRRELSANDVTLVVEVGQEVPPVALDEGQIRQVLLNLIKNARDAMSEGGTLTVRVSGEDDGVLISVKDTGVGMDEAQQARVFDLFYTTKTLGTGLGLPLTQQIVIAHGGRIRCLSEPKLGTTFELWFPAAPREAEREATVAAT